ncbi:MAG TPA: glycosyltransferase [Pirellulales bacterium]|nr:glycosyltransferase [Pirellulales bacterium]
MPRVSLTMIVRDEEANLPACLSSVAGLVDEIVIVDTGSTDGTRSVAQSYGARLFDFPWSDDFAAARNEALRHARGDWVFWLDADDRLDDENRTRLRVLFAHLTLDLAVWLLRCVSVSQGDDGSATVLEQGRLFRRDPRVRWEYRVHEQIVPSIQRLGGATRSSDVVVQHVGYGEARLRRAKLDRDLRLLALDLAERPDDPLVLFHLGWTHWLLGEARAALPVLERARQLAPPALAVVTKLYPLLVRCARQVGAGDAALVVCQEGLARHPDHAELLFHQGQLLNERRRFAEAEASLLRMVHLTASAGAAMGEDPALRGFKGRCVLAEVYRDWGRPADAEAQWQAALAEQPGYLVAWICLGDLYLAQGRWSDAEQLARRLETEHDRPADGLLLRARGHMTRREFTTARRLAETAVNLSPTTLMPREILSHILVLEGRDWAAAEDAVREVLARHPSNATALANLAVIQRRRTEQPSAAREDAGRSNPLLGGSIIVG